MANVRGIETGVIPTSLAEPIAVNGLRFFAGGLFLISMFGNFVLFNGGWDRLGERDGTAVKAFFFALAWQVVFSGMQFAFLRTNRHWWYLFALAASAIPSTLSFHEPLFPWLLDISGILFQWIDGPFVEVVATINAWLMLLIGVVGSDILPERILVKHKH